MRLSLLLPLVLLACGGDVGIVVPKEGATETDSGADGGEDGGAEPVDLDGDGHVAEDDCDDTNSDIFPGAPEVADDGIDQDCDGVDARTIYGHRDDTDNTALVENCLIGNIIALDAPLHVTHAGLTVREAFGEVRLGI